MKLLTGLLRIFVGGLFIFSGLIKVNDPVGTAIKMEEYFEVFGAHFIIPVVLPVSVLFVVLEVVLGVALLLGYKRNLTLYSLLGLIIFFTFLTFFSAYTGKVTDCGCFGDAIKLSPWQSFSKDVLLLSMIVGLIITKENIEPLHSEKGAFSGTILSAILSFALAFWAINHLPFIDFRAYKIGNNIPEKMRPSAPLRYRYIMERNGKTESFDQYPTEGGYTYKEMILVNPEDMAKITDYNIWSDEGDFTQESFQGKKLLIIIQNADKASGSNLAAIAQLVNDTKSTDIEPWVLSSSDKNKVERLQGEMGVSLPIYFADATVLKTIIRSNPGIVLLDKGTVKGQWHHNDTPTIEELSAKL